MGRNNNERSFYISLHGLRGLAAFMVFIGHTAGGFNEHYLIEGSIFLKNLNHLGTFGVEIFFVLSGFVIFFSIKKHDYKTFIWQRFWRIYPVFLFFTLLFFALNAISGKDPEKDNLLYLLYNVLQLNLFLKTPAMTPNAWSITYEIWFYIIAFILLRPLMVNRRRVLSIFGAFAASAFVARYPVALYFVGGMLISYLMLIFRDRFERISSSKIKVFELLALFVIVYLASSQNYIYKWSFIMSDWHLIALYFTTLLLIICVLHPASRCAKILSNSHLLFLGSMSYSLYLAHPYPYILSRKLMEYFGVVSLDMPLSFALYLIFATVLVLFFSYVVYRIVEVMPYEWATGHSIYAAPLKN